MTLDHGGHHTGERVRAADISSLPTCDMYTTGGSAARASDAAPNQSASSEARIATAASTPAARLARPLARQILARLVMQPNSFIIRNVSLSHDAGPVPVVWSLQVF